MKILLSDIHGSTLIFEKALKAISKYDIDVFIIGGDLSGKDVRPIIEEEGKFITEIDGKATSFSRERIRYNFTTIREGRSLLLFTNKKEFNILKNNPNRIMEILDVKILERLEKWIKIILDQINLDEKKVIISPGNDDIKQIDALLFKFKSNGIETGLENSISYENIEIVTLDYTNITPWKTERELTEKKLKKLISKKVGNIKSFENVIFNFHCPPYKTEKLDLAPKIDKNLIYDVKPGGIDLVHTGSTAVLESIEQFQPFLSLHGHIHESQGFEYIGRTLSLNPGSEHEKGILNAYIIDIDADCIIRDFYLLEE